MRQIHGWPQHLAATAFTFTATNGGFYPRCTEQTVRNLLRLPESAAVAAAHLNAKEVLADQGRFQAVMEAVAAARAVALVTNLVALEHEAAAKLSSSPTLQAPTGMHYLTFMPASEAQSRSCNPGQNHRVYTRNKNRE